MKSFVLSATIALFWAPPVSGQAWQHGGIQTRVFEYLAMTANRPDDVSFVAACAGIRADGRVIDPRARVLATATREVQSRDSTWNALHVEAAEAGELFEWERLSNSIDVLVPASKCSLLTEAMGVDLNSESQGQVAILMIDEWTTGLDGSFEIRALIGPAPFRRFRCTGWIEFERFSSACSSEEMHQRKR